MFLDRKTQYYKNVFHKINIITSVNIPVKFFFLNLFVGEEGRIWGNKFIGNYKYVKHREDGFKLE